MDIYYTTEEKYLQAIDELSFGETPKGLQLLNEIISNEPAYARAHFQLGMIWYYEIKDYQTAGYHFKLCTEFEPSFPDVYFHYLHLLVFLNMDKQIRTLKDAALITPGVEKAAIYNLLGLHSEKNKNWNEALENYHTAALESVSKSEKEDIEESIQRVVDKTRRIQKFNYQISA